jgi:methionyl-tRNA formyltransferase
VIHTLTIGKLTARKQDQAKATYTKLISKEDGCIDLKKPPASIKLERMIRAYHPWPGVWTKYNNKVLKLLPEKMVQLEGKQPISLANFKSGHRDFKLDW